MIIRDFVPGDETELRRIFMSSVHVNARGFYTEEQLHAWARADHDEEQWKARICTMRPFIAVVEGRLAGYADLRESGYIDHFFVAGDAARRGIGSVLMQHIHEVAAMRSLLRLSTDASLSAEAFFAKHGFLVDQRQTVVVRGVPLSNARMSKVLQANDVHMPGPQSSPA
jgi:putative acetyltransferase